MIDNYADLREWFINLKLPLIMGEIQMAVDMYDEALRSLTVGRISAFYRVVNLDRWLPVGDAGKEINWLAVAQDEFSLK